MAQLTWRNIDAPDLTGAANMMEQARKTVSGSLTGLSEILDKEAALQATNAKAAVQRNTQAGLNQIAQQYGTAAELEEALRNGGVQKIVDGYGGMIDEQQLGAQAMQQRIGQLRQSDLAQLNYDETAKKVADRGKFDSFLDIAATNDINAAVEFTKQNELGEYGKNAFDVIGLMRRNEFDQEKYRKDLKLRQAQDGRNAALHKYQIREHERAEAEREATLLGRQRYLQAVAADEAENQQQEGVVAELQGQIQELGKNIATTPMDMEAKRVWAEKLEEQLKAARMPVTRHQDALAQEVLSRAATGDATAIHMINGIEQGRTNAQGLFQVQNDIAPRQRMKIEEDIQNIDTELNKTFAGSQLLAPMKDSDYVDAVLEDVTKSINFTLTSNNVEAIKQSIAAAQEYKSFIPPKALAAVITAAVKDRDAFGTGLGKEAFEDVASQFAEAREKANTMYAQRKELNASLKGQTPDTSLQSLDEVAAMITGLKDRQKAMQEAEAANAQQNLTLPADAEGAAQASNGVPSVEEQLRAELSKQMSGNPYLSGNSRGVATQAVDPYMQSYLPSIQNVQEVLDKGVEAIEISERNLESARNSFGRGESRSPEAVKERATELAVDNWIRSNKNTLLMLSDAQVKLLEERLGIRLNPKTRNRVVD